MFESTAVFEANYNSKAHIVVNQGGTNSGKTFAILQVLACLAIETSKLVITVAGQDVPNLKAGPIRDITGIIRDTPGLKSYIERYNRSDRELYFTNGSIIEFKSYDDEQDAKSGKRDYLFVNEANGIPWNIYSELALRTKNRIFIDYNPNASFWVHDNLIGKPGVELFISDHRHNPFLPQQVRDKIEALKQIDEELWRVYARGLTGKIDGVILRNWFLCDEIPDTAKLIAVGLDFGFTNDQTGALEVYMQNGELWVNELIYETGLTNPDIDKKLVELGISKNVDLICDSAEPKSIEELYRMGWIKAEGAKKGADSITNSIDILKRYKINVTRNSINIRHELMRYIWRKDKKGKVLNEPIDAYNHLIDPLRYVALNKLRLPREVDFGWD